MSRFRYNRIGSTSSCTRENDIVSCNQDCLNGGQVIDGKCVCHPDYWGSDGLDCCRYESCSWKPGKFCYPGECPQNPSSCTCTSDFSGDNCLTIDTKPSLDQCTGTFRRPESEYTPYNVACHVPMTAYCPIRAETLVVNWEVSFIPQLNGTDTPYYVNETGFGIILAVIDWTLARGTTVVASGRSECFNPPGGILAIPADKLPTRTCRNEITINKQVHHQDKFSFSIIAKNGGYMKLNNYAVPGIVTVDSPTHYQEKMYHETTLVYFDFYSPYHCSSGSMPCTPGEKLIINSAFIKTNQISVQWNHDDWYDDLGGIDHFRCDVYRLTAGSDGKLGMNSVSPHATKDNLGPSVSSTSLTLSEKGLYSLVLSVIDRAGNRARARRFVMFDNQNSIEVDGSRPVTAKEAAINVGVNWLSVSEGKVTVTWDGHFTNPFHRDNKLLNEIEEFSPTTDDDYDENTGQPPITRSREAIPNADGIVKFQISIAQATSRKVQPSQWTTIKAPTVEHEITFNAVEGDTLTIWLKAYDAMDNVMDESVDFYIDTTPPTVSHVILMDDLGQVIESDKAVMDFEKNLIKIQAFDQESGLKEINWQLVDLENVVLGNGKLNMTQQEDKGCQCSCITSLTPKVCFSLDNIITADTIEVLDINPNTKVDCVMKMIIVNNALLETSTDISLTVRSPVKPTVSRHTSNNSGGIAGGVVVVLIILIVIVAIIILWRLGKLNCRKNDTSRSNPPPPVAKPWSNLSINGNDDKVGYPNKGYEYSTAVDEVIPTKSNNLAYPPPRPPKTNNYHKVVQNNGKVLMDSGLTRDEMEFPSSQLELVELLKSGIYKANATNIGGIHGLSIVVVKTLKDKHSKSQRESLLHELDVMLQIMPHDNVIRLLGCMVECGSPKPSIIMEYACYENLSGVLRRSHQLTTGDGSHQTVVDNSIYGNLFKGSDSLTSIQMMRYAEEIASGMEHLADLNIIHRKLAARNIFVGENNQCKIGSFAMAIQTDEAEIQDNRETRLPIRWMATESLKYGIFSKMSDVWAYGVVVWEIVTLGALPYTTMKNKEIIERVKKGYRMEKPPHCTQEIYTIMLRCWNGTAHERPSFSELVNEVRNINKNEEVVNLSKYDSELYGDLNEM
ncbi:uncharacterized protein LOC144452654 [Glandiceps talaboti]